MRRIPTGQRVELQPRDIEIFKLLNRYRYLRSTYIHAFVGGDKTKLIERLGKLYHEGGYLDRPTQQWESLSARHQPAVYEITRKARDVLREEGYLSGHSATPGARSFGARRRAAAISSRSHGLRHPLVH